MKKNIAMLGVIALLALVSSIASAETPDECAARLDQSIAIKTYQQAEDWWATVQRECEPQPETASTPEPTEIPDYMGIYGWEGDFVFCVMSPGLNIRNSPAGSVIDQLDKGNLFTIDLASQTLLDGYVWGKHDKGWSAIFRYPLQGNIDDFTHPNTCPKPTPSPTATRQPTRTSTTTHPVLQMGQTKTFTLSGADCLIAVDQVNVSQPGNLLLLTVARGGWVRDNYWVDLIPPGGRSALSFEETELSDDGENYYFQIYSPEITKDVLGFYTVDVNTGIESKKFKFRVTLRTAYNFTVACV